MYQVALGMRYLESQKIVHRNLAARNVMLVNQQLAKISDYSMYRIIELCYGSEDEYGAVCYENIKMNSFILDLIVICSVLLHTFYENCY